MNLEDRFSASDDVVSREVGGETVLLDLESGIYFGLNEVGGRIWQLLEEQDCSLDEICNVIQKEFDVEREIAAQDILKLAAELKERNLLIPA